MKQNLSFKHILTVAVCALSVASCSLDYEPKTGPSSGNFPANITEAEYGLYAAYKSLSTFDASSVAWWKVADNITDIGVTRVNTAKFTELVTSAATGENAVSVKIYNTIYNVVSRINLVLDGLGNLEGKEPAEDIAALRNELLCLRAFCYDMGCQYYGDMPYIDHSLSLTDNQYPRTPREEVTAKLLADLSDENIATLPLHHNQSQFGTARIGQVAAYGLRARIALEWGNYELAATSAAKAIALAKEAGYELQPLDLSFCGEDHDAGEPTGTVDLFGYAGHANSKEWIWCVQFDRRIDGNTLKEAYYQLSRVPGGCAYFGPSQHFIDMFQCTDGKSISESPLYDWQHPWKNRDPRLDLYCVRPGSRLYNYEFQTSKNAKTIKDYNTGADVSNLESQGTKGVYGANGSKGPGGYLWRKHIDIAELDNGSITSSSPSDMNCGLMRLAELYLIEAEANIEWTSGDLALAKKDLDLIRSRVGMPEVDGSSRESLRKALRYERAVELCDEGFRWFDLRRWGIAEKAVNGTIYAPAQDGSMSNARPSFDDNWLPTYDGSTFDGQAMNLRVYNTYTYRTGKDELWPIPQTELDTNPLINENNPGY